MNFGGEKEIALLLSPKSATKLEALQLNVQPDALNTIVSHTDGTLCQHYDIDAPDAQ